MEILDISSNNQYLDIEINSEHGKACYKFSTDMDRINKMINWLFENTSARFVLLGTDRIYFESREDAMAFKLRWL